MQQSINKYKRKYVLSLIYAVESIPFGHSGNVTRSRSRLGMLQDDCCCLTTDGKLLQQISIHTVVIQMSVFDAAF